MRYLKQSTSVDVGIGPFLDSADGVTAETSLSITQPDIRLKKNNGNWAQKNASQTLSHEENGWYEVTLDATDTNTLGILLLAVAESGAAPVWHEFTVLAANVYDSLIGGGDLLDVSVAEAAGTTVQAASGRFQVDLELWLGSAPNALSSGRVDATVGAMQANVMTAAAAASDLTTELQNGLATAAALTTVEGKIDTVDTVVDGIAAKTTNLPSDPADASEIAAATGAILTAVGDLNDISVSEIFTTKITESYSTKGEERTLGDFVYEIAQRDQEASISSTTVTINEIDGTTPAFTLTMDDAAAPTSVTRAT